MRICSAIQFLAMRRRPDDSTRENAILTDRPFVRDELIEDYSTYTVRNAQKKIISHARKPRRSIATPGIAWTI